MQGKEFDIRIGTSNANPYRFNFKAGLEQKEIWLETLRRSNDLTAFVFTAAGETAPTTNLDKHLLALAWAKRCCEYVLSNDKDDREAQATLDKILSRSGENLPGLLADYQKSLETTPRERAHPGRNYVSF